MPGKSLTIYVMSSAILISSLFTGCSLPDGSFPDNNVPDNGISDDVVTDNGVSQIDDITVEGFVSVEDVQSIFVRTHDPEAVSASEYGEQYTVEDTVSVTYEAGILNGMLIQTVTKDMTFCLNGSNGEWELKKEELTSCEVDSEPLKGSVWKCENLSADVLSGLFGARVPDGENGVLYIRIMKNMGLFAFNPANGNNISTERFFQTAGTNANVIWAGESSVVEIKCGITGGSVTDAGVLNLDFESVDNTVSICFGRDALPVSEKEYDEAAGKDIENSKVYMDSLPVFEVTTKSIENGEWKQETGLMIDNVSPELTWDAVDGATKYAVIMLDTTTNNWLSWFVIVDDTTHLDEGTYTEKDVYVGPYPPGTHTYEIFVIALRTDPKPVSFPMDASGGDINSKMNMLNTASDGSTGNVLAYGTVKADYTADEMYYGYR